MFHFSQSKLSTAVNRKNSNGTAPVAGISSTNNFIINNGMNNGNNNSNINNGGNINNIGMNNNGNINGSMNNNNSNNNNMTMNNEKTIVNYMPLPNTSTNNDSNKKFDVSPLIEKKKFDKINDLENYHRSLLDKISDEKNIEKNHDKNGIKNNFMKRNFSSEKGLSAMEKVFEKDSEKKLLISEILINGINPTKNLKRAENDSPLGFNSIQNNAENNGQNYIRSGSPNIIHNNDQNIDKNIDQNINKNSVSNRIGSNDMDLNINNEKDKDIGENIYSHIYNSNESYENENGSYSDKNISNKSNISDIFNDDNSLNNCRNILIPFPEYDFADSVYGLEEEKEKEKEKELFHSNNNTKIMKKIRFSSGNIDTEFFENNRFEKNDLNYTDPLLSKSKNNLIRSNSSTPIESYFSMKMKEVSDEKKVKKNDFLTGLKKDLALEKKEKKEKKELIVSSLIGNKTDREQDRLYGDDEKNSISISATNDHLKMTQQASGSGNGIGSGSGSGINNGNDGNSGRGSSSFIGVPLLGKQTRNALKERLLI